MSLAPSPESTEPSTPTAPDLSQAQARHHRGHQWTPAAKPPQASRHRSQPLPPLPTAATVPPHPAHASLLGSVSPLPPASSGGRRTAHPPPMQARLCLSVLQGIDEGRRAGPAASVSPSALAGASREGVGKTLTSSEQDGGINVKPSGRSHEWTGPASFLDTAARFSVAMVVLDAWQYFMHRVMHTSQYMYRRFHSWHHRIVAPYAFAAQYNHPVDGVLTETLSGAAAFLASGMGPRGAAAFFVFATVKGIDHHCGVLMPWNLLHAVFRDNNTAYHDVHHQLGGGRRNFSQSFFVIWDRLLGTYAGYTLEERHGGGLKVKIIKDHV